MSLRVKTIKGVLWNAFEMLGGKTVQIVITIILARILAPEDFGIIGLLVIFSELSKVILDSGFSQALIRKNDVNQSDFSSVFYFNIVVGTILYVALYLSAPYISNFYDYPELTNVSRVVFLSIFINSFGIVQNAKIVKEVNFKILANRAIIANLIAGAVAVYLAYIGFGVWALVWQMVLASLLGVILLWIYSKWLPSLKFSFETVRSLFAFSGNLLLSGVFDVIVANIQGLLIGKFYTKADLGFYSQAKQLSSIPSQTLTAVIRNVTYPTLSVIQDNVKQLKDAYRKVIRIAIFVVTPLMLGLLAVGNNLIPFILGDNWKPAIDFFMLLCVTGAIFPLNSVNLSIILVRGKGKTYLKLSILKRIITIIAILLTIKYSVLALVIGQVLATIINTIITMIYSGKEINYRFSEQIKDIGGIILISLIMAGSVFLFGHKVHIESYLWMLLSQAILGLVIFITITFLFKLDVLEDLKGILVTIRNRNKE